MIWQSDRPAGGGRRHHPRRHGARDRRARSSPPGARRRRERRRRHLRRARAAGGPRGGAARRARARPRRRAGGLAAQPPGVGGRGARRAARRRRGDGRAARPPPTRSSRAQLDDSGAKLVVTLPGLASRVGARDVIAAGPDLLARARPCAVGDAPRLALLPYSSGTTGLPKAVVITHRNLSTAVRQFQAGLRLTERDTLLAVAPFAHVMGFVPTSRSRSRPARPS